MKKIIITIILLVLSIAAASAKTTMNLDSIFANTLAFKARLDTAIYYENSVFLVSSDKFAPTALNKYYISITCYNKIKDNKMKKKEIPGVIKDILENYEPYLDSILSKPVKEVQYYDEPITTRYTETIFSCNISVDGDVHHCSIEKPHYETKYHDDLESGTWYSRKSIKHGDPIDDTIIYRLKMGY